MGSWGGDNNPDYHFPKYIRWIDDGTINVDGFTNMLYRLEDMNIAIENMKTGKAVKPIYCMPNE